MSVIFSREIGDAGECIGGDDQVLADVGNARASNIRYTTVELAGCIGLPSGFSDIINSEIFVNEKEFCGLVDAIFAEPFDLIEPDYLSKYREYVSIAEARRLHLDLESCQAAAERVPLFPRRDGRERAPRLRRGGKVFGLDTPVSPWRGAQMEFRNLGGHLILTMNRPLSAMLIRFMNNLKLSYGMPSGLTIKNEGQCLVDEAEFCQLVDAGFQDAATFSEPLACYVAGMYEVIRGSLFDWRLDGTNPDHPLEIQAVRYPESPIGRAKALRTGAAEGRRSLSSTAAVAGGEVFLRFIAKLGADVGNGDNEDRILAIIDTRRALRIRERLIWLGKAYGLPSGVGENVEQNIAIKQAQFCRLVETMFANPVDLMDDCVSDIAGMYEILEGEECTWIWNPRRPPLSVLPIYRGADAWDGVIPLPSDDGTVGPRIPASYNGGPQLRFVSVDGKVIVTMDRPLAMIYILVTEDVAAIYRMASGFQLVDVASCVVDEDRFCLLLDAVFKSADPLVNGWASYAAGMYEIIRGKLCLWDWGLATSNSRQSMLSVRYANSPREECVKEPCST